MGVDASKPLPGRGRGLGAHSRASGLGMAAALAIAVLAGWHPAAAQDPAPDDGCPLLTIDEVAAALDSPGLTLAPGADDVYCFFDGEPYLQIQLQSQGLEEMKALDPDGVAVTVGERAGWWSPQFFPSLLVEADDGIDGSPRVLQLGTSVIEERDPLPGLVELAALALPRLPGPPAASAVEYVRSLIPERLGDVELTLSMDTGDSLLWALQFQPADAEALAAALAAAGRKPQEAFFVNSTTGSWQDQAIVAIQLPGVDAASVMLPVVRAFYPPSEDLGMTELGGKQVHVLATDPSRYAYTSGDLVFYVNDLGLPLDDFFASLP